MRWLLGWRYISSLHSADEPQEGRNSCPLLRSYFIGSQSCWCLETFLTEYQPCSLFLVFIHFLADQISCRSYVASVYRMRSLAVYGFSIPLAMITMRKSTHGFLFLSYMSMGLRLVALRAAGAPLLSGHLPFPRG